MEGSSRGAGEPSIRVNDPRQRVMFSQIRAANSTCVDPHNEFLTPAWGNTQPFSQKKFHKFFARNGRRRKDDSICLEFRALRTSLTTAGRRALCDEVQACIRISVTRFERSQRALDIRIWFATVKFQISDFKFETRSLISDL